MPKKVEEKVVVNEEVKTVKKEPKVDVDSVVNDSRRVKIDIV